MDTLAAYLQHHSGMALACSLLLYGILQWKLYRTPLDWDTSSHLYFAFLKGKGIHFLSSYKPGIKWGLPRIYSGMWRLLDHGNPHRFRALNILSGAAVLGLTVGLDPNHTGQDPWIYLLLAMFIPSLYVNAATSASEFLTVPCTLAAVYACPLLGYPAGFALQLGLILFMVYALKMVDGAYLLPVVCLQAFELGNSMVVTAAGAGLVSGATLLVMLALKKTKSDYRATRSFLHSKNINFLLCNPVFILALIGLTGFNLLHAPLVGKSLLAAAFIVLLVQKMPSAYYWYPLGALNLFVASRYDVFQAFDPTILMGCAAAFFLCHSLPHILMIRSGNHEAHFRRFFFRDPGARQTLEQRKQQVEWLRANIPASVDTYLWGSKVSLLLLAGLKHVEGTYYNHNHLVYWSGIKDPRGYALDFIRSKRPEFIIASGMLQGFLLSPEELMDGYTKIHELDDMQVYKLA